MAENDGREPWHHPRVKWWAWFIPTIIFFIALLVAVKRFRTPMERGATSAAPVAEQVRHLA